jgi:hypothetical protein
MRAGHIYFAELGKILNEQAILLIDNGHNNLSRGRMNGSPLFSPNGAIVANSAAGSWTQLSRSQWKRIEKIQFSILIHDAISDKQTTSFS